MTLIGKKLKELRGRRSLREIERLSGISHTHLSNIEKGIDPRNGKELIPSPIVLSKLAKTYQTNYYELLILAGYLDADTYKNQLEQDIKQILQSAELVAMFRKAREVKEILYSDGIDLNEFITSDIELYYKNTLLTDDDKKFLTEILERTIKAKK